MKDPSYGHFNIGGEDPAAEVFTWNKDGSSNSGVTVKEEEILKVP